MFGCVSNRRIAQEHTHIHIYYKRLFAQTKIFVYGSFWTTTCTHESSQDANFDSTEFFTTCLFEASFQSWSFIIFLFNKYEVSNFYQIEIVTSRFRNTFVFSYLISHDSIRYISFPNVHHFFPVKIISIINAVMTTHLIYCI